MSQLPQLHEVQAAAERESLLQVEAERQEKRTRDEQRNAAAAAEAAANVDRLAAQLLDQVRVPSLPRG